MDKQVFYEFERTKESEGDSANPRYELYHLRHGADVDFNLIATDAEVKYCNDNSK